MGKKGKGKQGDLGKALLRDRFGVNRSKREAKDGSLLHTAEVNDGYQWDRLNLSSVTEQSSFQEFLSTAQLAGTEFHAEKLNIKYVNPQNGIGIISEAERLALLEVHKSNQSLLKIPRRPKWDAHTSAYALQTKEKEDFLEWRRQLALLQDAQELTMTPYEKNLEFWRQLWRVVERSDIIVQIVDARNPLLFRCEDLEKYVSEIDSNKLTMILINKADFLTTTQRQQWSDYFSKNGVKVAFFSATEAAESIKSQYPEEKFKKNKTRERLDDLAEEDSDNDNSSYCSDFISTSDYESADDNLLDSCSKKLPPENSEKSKNYSLGTATTSQVTIHPKSTENNSEDSGKKSEFGNKILELESESPNAKKKCENEIPESENKFSKMEKDFDVSGEKLETSEQETSEAENQVLKMRNHSDLSDNCGKLEENLSDVDKRLFENSSELLSRDKLIEFFKKIGESLKKFTEGVTTVGLVGYPNVGKSSTINAILMDKKVSVSATPGKTKHYQTLFVDKELLLCDCPGLVMPSFVCTKAEMVLNGILPIDQLRDHVPSVTLLATLIPRYVLEDIYGIMIPKPIDGEDPDRPPTAEELLNTYGYNRGFMTQNGQPDNPRSARYILKDFVNGRLLYPVSPPNIKQEEFHTFPPRRKIVENRILPPRQVRASRGVTVNTEDLDRNFFQGKNSGVHTKGLAAFAKGVENPGDKPWKKMNKHGNKKKKEKTRRLFAHLDQH